MNRKDLDQYFKLYAHCIPVKGATRSIICDLKRSPGYYPIPNSLYEILIMCQSRSYADLIKDFGDDQLVLDDYFSFLLRNELGFWCDKDELQFFPNMQLKWDFPGEISNAIIDIAAHSRHPFPKIFSELASLGCRNIQLRIYDFITIHEIRAILSFINEKPFFYIELIAKFDLSISKEEWISLIMEFTPVCKVVVHSAIADELVYEKEGELGNIFYIKQPITSQAHCGFIHKEYFASNIQQFTEAQHFNTCLNKKISIDVEGNIKNCPAIQQKFGNIQIQSFQEALGKKDFKQLWYLRKDQTLVCRDCEFRYICTDCRAFLQEPEILNSKPLKCGYDPYTGKWEHWRMGSLSQEAIAYYEMKNIF